MGWFATYKALENGTGPYGSVRESLWGESDPTRTLHVALDHVNHDLHHRTLVLDRSARARISHWAKRAGYNMTMDHGLYIE